MNATDADDTVNSRGSLVRFAAPIGNSASTDRRVELASRYTLGIAIARP